MYSGSEVKKQDIVVYSGSEVKKQDIADYARQLVALLHHCKDKDQRVTANKLCDVWLGKGPPALRLSHIKPPKLAR